MNNECWYWQLVTASVPRAQCWVQSCLFIIWMRGSSAPSASLQWHQAGCECWSAGGQGALQRDLHSLDPWARANCVRFSQAKCWLLSLGHNSPCSSSWDSVAGKLLSGKGPGGAGQQWLNMSQGVPRGPRRPRTSWMCQQWCGQQDQGSDCPSVLGTGEATPQILGSALGPSQERDWGAGTCPEKGNRAGEGSGAQSSATNCRGSWWCSSWTKRGSRVTLLFCITI